jgi:hypothetical protein
MLELVRKGNQVTHGANVLTIVKQESKGPGNEVVKIEGLPGSEGAKWISLKKLVEGTNVVEVKGKEITSGSGYTLTKEEREQVEELEAQIKKIKDVARSRYVAKPKYVDPTTATKEQKEQAIKEYERYLEMLKG